jgi:hypothetical protein
MTSEELANVYGVSAQRLRLLRGRGAPIENPDALLDWLREHSSQLGPLISFLIDECTRRDLKRRIDFICENKHSKSFAC